MVSRAGLADYLADLPKDDLPAWLSGYLLDHDTPPSTWPPHPYPDRFTFLLDTCREFGGSPLGVQIGDAATIALRSLLPSDGPAHLLSPEAETLIPAFLRLVELLPASDPGGVTEYLNRVRQRADLRCWPNPSQDAHRGVLFALANHLRAILTDPARWEERLEPELADPIYANTAVMALAQQSLPAAIRRLPEVAELFDRRPKELQLLFYFLADELARKPDGLTDYGTFLASHNRADLVAKIVHWLRLLGHPRIADTLSEAAEGQVTSPRIEPAA